MIRIDRISFDFTVRDEGFAQGLYADWDRFCRRCFESVAQECLAPYSDDRALHELELLDLDLGSIPEDGFYDEFPRRLREALLKALPPLYRLQAQTDSRNNAVFRLSGLLYYLEHGHPMPEWADTDFGCREETQWLARQSSGFRRDAVRKLALLCLDKGYPLRRLVAQAGDENLLLDIYAAAITESTAGLSVKRRLLALTLDTMPEIPVRYVRRAADDGSLQEMSSLLDTLTVRQIIRTESKEHAEVDLPPYWHYLYEWLIRYYPYNGIAMFGSKAEFTRHLHHRLLTFIRKRSGASYLSKEELTVSFLLEVFGPAYYRSVLNAIYLLQPHRPDGSPIYDSYFNMELYRTFMRLSLLQFPADMNDDSSDGVNKSDLLISEMTRLVSDTAVTDTALRSTLVRAMDSRPEALSEWIAQKADFKEISRLSEVFDGQMAQQWVQSLSSTPGLAHPSAFRRLAAWLMRRMPPRELAESLFLLVKDPGWKTYTEEQLETFFFSRMTAGTDALLQPETLADESLPEGARKRLFLKYVRLRPERLIGFIRESVSKNSMPLEKFLDWTEASDWSDLIASISISKAELLKQMADCLSLPETERKKAFAVCLLRNEKEDWTYSTPRETVRGFVEALPSMQGKKDEIRAETVQRIEASLGLPDLPATAEDEGPEVLITGSAGLCLLAPWLVRLFSILGYLDEKGREFWNISPKVRAVFLLQYIVYGEEREWREAELTFNRLLTALPGHVPLPVHLALSDEEKQTADGMVAGVKANWPQMNGTSAQGFRASFLARTGTLVQEEQRWLLTVEEKSYDILLDTVPWGFRQIRLPWLKKHVQVKWHEKQEF